MSGSVGEHIAALVDYALQRGLIEESDRIWAFNQLLDTCGYDNPGQALDSSFETVDLDGLLTTLCDDARASGTLDDGCEGTYSELFAAKLMGLLAPRPSAVAARFEELSLQAPERATDYLYRLSQDVGYVHTSAIARNICWTTDTAWGPLEITINKSKPEKDPRAIAKLLEKQKDSSEVGEAQPYPACQLCFENEGYAGRDDGALGGAHPARQNLRIVPLELGHEPWGLQFSPYGYYAEHCIVINIKHINMHIDRKSIDNLLEFADKFPHYFIGSNADLPIVGGSILNHDHFQGGKHRFPLDNATLSQRFSIPGFDAVFCGVVKWPLTVLRLVSSDRGQLLGAACRVLDQWRSWDDSALGIISHTEGEGGQPVPHNTITPFAHCTLGADGSKTYRLDLALRCNITSEEHPLGVFHPHAELHHVKRENIGLIEVAGLAILPPRLEEEFGPLDDPIASAPAREEIGQTFAKVLEHCGVFKWDDAGRAGLNRFIASL